VRTGTMDAHIVHGATSAAPVEMDTAVRAAAIAFAIALGVWLVVIVGTALLVTCTKRRHVFRATTQEASSRLDFEQSEARLRVVRRDGAYARLNVKRFLFVLAVGLAILGFTPVVCRIVTGIDEVKMTQVHGSERAWMAILPPAVTCVALIVSPIDKREIRGTCWFMAVLLVVASIVAGRTVIEDLHAGVTCVQQQRGVVARVKTSATTFLRQHPDCWRGVHGITLGLVVLAIFLCILALVPALRCGERAMPARAALHRVWNVLRAAALAFGVCFLPFSVVSFAASDANPPQPGVAGVVLGASSLVSALAVSPANRGRVIRLMCQLLPKGHSALQEAAAVAALLGKQSVDDALATAMANFRALPLAALTPSDLASNQDGVGLFDQSCPVVRGARKWSAVHLAFVSHSWSDPGAAKYARLKQWGDELRTSTKAPAREPFIWLDKACINQQNITEALAGLPIYVASCQELLVLAGPTWASRLWASAGERARGLSRTTGPFHPRCVTGDAPSTLPTANQCVVELFVWFKMGGEPAKDRIRLFDLSEDTTELRKRFATFRADDARCTFEKDRQRLLGVIEHGFGDLRPFEKRVRKLLDTLSQPQERQATEGEAQVEGVCAAV